MLIIHRKCHVMFDDFHREQVEEIVRFFAHRQENLVVNMHNHQIHLEEFHELV